MPRLACLLVLLAATLLAAPAASAITAPETIRLVDVQTRSEELDGLSFESNTPPRTGQRFVFTDALYRWQGSKRGRQIGRLEGICTFTKVDPERFAVTASCNAYVYLPAGKLLINGFVTFSEQGGPVFRLPVLGGTGRYSNAHGTATIRELAGEGDVSALTLRLFPLPR